MNFYLQDIYCAYYHIYILFVKKKNIMKKYSSTFILKNKETDISTTKKE